jgi:hypothetical protein
MKRNIRILSFRTGLIGGASEIAAIPSDERPVMLQNEPLQFSVLPSGFTQPGHMRTFAKAAVAGQRRQVWAETFVDQKLRNHFTLQSEI